MLSTQLHSLRRRRFLRLLSGGCPLLCGRGLLCAGRALLPRCPLGQLDACTLQRHRRLSAVCASADWRGRRATQPLCARRLLPSRAALAPVRLRARLLRWRLRPVRLSAGILLHSRQCERLGEPRERHRVPRGKLLPGRRPRAHRVRGPRALSFRRTVGLPSLAARGSGCRAAAAGLPRWVDGLRQRTGGRR